MKMKYKDYPREYEKVFSSTKSLKKFSFEILKTDYPGGKEKYLEKFRQYAHDFERLFFAGILQFWWLRRRFSYYGYSKAIKNVCPSAVSAAYGVFIKHVVNFNYLMFTSTFFYNKVTTYLQDFFPDFDNHNPFEEPEYFKYPYEYISLAHLVLVYQLDERIDLLKKAEAEKMTYYEFLDFILNYTLCVNDEFGKTIYTFMKPTVSNQFPPYVRYHFRKKDKKGNVGFHFQGKSKKKYE